MALADNRRLVDVITRYQVYLEGVKVWYARGFTKALVDLSVEFRKLFAQIEFDNLDALSKKQVTDFVRELRDLQKKTYNRLTQELLAQLRDFMVTDATVSRKLFSSLIRGSEGGDNEDDETPGEFVRLVDEQGDEDKGMLPLALLRNNDRLWTHIQNAPIPANGTILKDFFGALFYSLTSSAAQSFVIAYANHETKQQALARLIGSTSNRSGVLYRAGFQGAAVIDSAIQHISGIVQSGFASLFYEFYMWVSIIDSATTDICRARNRKIFQYGNGPLPPAHIHCRSRPVPWRRDSSESDAPASYGAWRNTQPSAVREDLPEDFRSSPLTLKQFLAKLSFMLNDDEA